VQFIWSVNPEYDLWLTAMLTNYRMISPCLTVNGRCPDYPLPTIPLPISPPHSLINKTIFQVDFLISGQGSESHGRRQVKIREIYTLITHLTIGCPNKVLLSFTDTIIELNASSEAAVL